MIKLIAFDMDETFMRGKGVYDRARFSRIYAGLQERGIQVLPISGDQYAQIASFFPMADQLTIASFNGSLVHDRGKLVKGSFLPEADIQGALRALKDNHLDKNVMLAGEHYCYFREDTTQDFHDHMDFYFSKFKVLPSFWPLPEQRVAEICLRPPKEQLGEAAAILTEACPDLQVFVSGVGSIDLLLPGVSKGRTLKWLAGKRGIKASEIMAFGDGLNDVEMLQFAGQSYAMLNASDQVKSAAKHVTRYDYRHDGVLDVIEREVLNK